MDDRKAAKKYVVAEDRLATNWIPAKAFVVPKETAPEGEGYFAIVEGHNHRLYIGTHANAKNCYLVEFNPATGQMKTVVDAQKVVGSTATGFAAQAKIHSRNNVGESGKIYFATKQGYPAKTEARTDYPGGYPMVYDPATGKTKVYPIPVPHLGLISITPDESRNLIYLSTCSDTKPDSTHFLILDMKTEKYRDLLDCEHSFAFIVVDHLGRAYHPIRGGDIARYDPESGKLERLKQTIDGVLPANHLADENAHPINWDISSDRKTLYAVPMNGNTLYAYDLTAKGDTLPGRNVGTLITGATNTDCRALCVGPTGTVWCTVTMPGNRELHLIRYRPGKDEHLVDLGRVFVSNPDFTQLKGENGKPLPFHGGFTTLKDGRMVTKVVNLGICEAHDGAVYSLALQPFTVLQYLPDKP